MHSHDLRQRFRQGRALTIHIIKQLACIFQRFLSGLRVRIRTIQHSLRIIHKLLRTGRILLRRRGLNTSIIDVLLTSLRLLQSLLRIRLSALNIRLTQRRFLRRLLRMTSRQQPQARHLSMNTFHIIPKRIHTRVNLLSLRSHLARLRRHSRRRLRMLPTLSNILLHVFEIDTRIRDRTTHIRELLIHVCAGVTGGFQGLIRLRISRISRRHCRRSLRINRRNRVLPLPPLLSNRTLNILISALTSQIITNQLTAHMDLPINDSALLGHLLN